MKKFNVRVIAEIAIFAAIAVVLDILQGGIWKAAFANGGSIGFAMVPIFVIAYRRGLIAGLICGLIVSILQMLGGIYVINSGSLDGWKGNAGPYIQVMLDYVLAYTVVGFSGAFAGLYRTSEGKKKVLFVIIGCVIGGLLKYLCHVLSGIFFWPGKMWGVSGHAYSWLYNGLYMIPNIVVCTVVMAILAVFYPVFFEAPEAKELEASEVVKKEEVTE